MRHPRQTGMVANLSRSIAFPGATRSGRAGDLAVAVGGMLALAAGMGIGRFVYTPILPPMADALGLTKTDAGLIAAANFVGYLAGALMLAAPLFATRRRTWLLGGLLLGAATTAAMGVVNGFPSFMLLRLLGGIASAFVLVLGSALVLDRLAAGGRSGLAGLHFAGVGLGIAVSAMLIDVLLAAGAGWRTLWLTCGAVSAAAVPVAAWLVPDGSRSAPDGAPVTPAAQGTPRGLGALSLCHGLFGFGYVVTATFLVAAVRAAPAARVLEPTVWLVVGLAAMPSTILWNRFGARWGVLRAYGIACLVEAIGVAAGGLWSGAAGALLAAFLVGGTFMGITGLGFAAARALGAHAQRRSFALMTAGFGAGQIVGPVVAGWLMDRTGGFALPSGVAAAALLAGAAIALTRPRQG